MFYVVFDHDKVSYDVMEEEGTDVSKADGRFEYFYKYKEAKSFRDYLNNYHVACYDKKIANMTNEEKEKMLEEAKLSPNWVTIRPANENPTTKKVKLNNEEEEKEEYLKDIVDAKLNPDKTKEEEEETK